MSGHDDRQDAMPAPASASRSPASAASSGTPDERAGRTVSTQRLYAGYGIGPLGCEAAGGGGTCFLTETQRTRLDAELGLRAVAAASAWADACNQVATDELLREENGWTALSEIIFQAASAVLGGAIARGVKTLLKTAEASLNLGVAAAAAGDAGVDDAAADRLAAAVKGTFVFASKGARTALKNASHGAPAGKEARVRLAQTLADSTQVWALDVRTGARGLDDLGMIALCESLDPASHQQSQYAARVRALLATFQRTVLDVGTQRFEGSAMRPSVVERRVIWITDGATRRRLASADAIHGARWRFREWIDDALQDAARNAAEQPPTSEVPDGETSWTGIPEVSGFDDRLDGADTAALQEWLVPSAARGPTVTEIRGPTVTEIRGPTVTEIR